MNMLGYYLDLALRSFRASRGLSLLMILALGLGIGACMTTLTVFHVLGGDPIPGKSERLFNVQLDPEPNDPTFKPGDEPTLQLTRFDAETLLRAKKAKRQVMMTGSQTAVLPEDPALKPFITMARWTSADFFTMFEAPFQYGSGWDEAADLADARVVVISHSLNEKLFGGANSVGREIRLREQGFRVVGVLKPWRPVPHYFDLTLGAYSAPAEVYAPISTSLRLNMGATGNMSCWGDLGGKHPRDLNVPCAWLQYWVELESAAQAEDYRKYLQQYSEEQGRAGRFERPANVRLRPVMAWLEQQQVLPSDVRLQVWLAFGFLLVCLTNTVGLLLAKSLRRSAEIGVRRALGATRRAIFQQFLVEAGVLGLIGGLLGLALAALGLWLVRLSPTPYAALAEMDWPMLALTLGLALLASLTAGLLPAWHAAGVSPARQLKTQ
ncbi:ABC transporter permease [Paucibacter sp. DJ2R-2]|uniref:ABC transporter permease n=1 Tax=Paucibacter sp. DJ2R-2 TaxID=2893558 RepID=UPI0021E482CB|nr:ABC transporter permease [Paucibacter sp. DJ2R-2]MCV2422107.1 ABC transporter permease [Paucibacter sp. DJ4R-1]MCV2440309.1 ABC transporter permease [Paucibacter sp. DJ2R-2]